MDPLSRHAAVRRIAKRRGYSASRSRLRDPLAVGYGQWTITSRTGERVSPPGGWTLDQVEQWLADQEAEFAAASAGLDRTEQSGQEAS